MSTRSSYLRRPKSAAPSKSTSRAGGRNRPATARSRRYKNGKPINPEPVSLDYIKPTPRWIDIVELIQNVIRESSVEILEQMQPQNLFGQFLQKKMFDKVIIRDMQELQSTLERNEAIKGLITEHTDKYKVFKICLAETGQFPLVETLQIREIKMHDHLKGLGHICCCTNTDNCSQLMTIRCAPAKFMRIALSQPAEDNPILRLQSNLINLYQHFCLCEPVYPLRPGADIPVKTMYVKPSLSTLQTKSTPVQTLPQHGRNANKKKFMESFNEVFYRNDTPCRNIYITGESGSGKSALCERLVRRWCEAHIAKQKGIHTDMSQDDEVFGEFSLLFYISLSAARNETDIEDMIKAQQLTTVDISHFLEKEKCLVILDGLDEWKLNDGLNNQCMTEGIPNRKTNMNKTVVLTTSRQWKLATVCLNEDNIDHLITLTTLCKSSVEHLSENAIQILDEDKDKKNTSSNKLVGSFIKDITTDNKLHYLDVPILQIQMLTLWFEGTPFGSSECETYSTIIDGQMRFATDMISNTDPEGVTEESFDLPDCLASKEYCKKNQTLIVSLSKLAYNTLLLTDRENAMVFDIATTRDNGMHEEDVAICKDIGILTQNLYFGTMTDDLKTVNFIHKSHHEFLAAVFLASNYKSKGIGHVTNTINSFEMVMELEQMIVFASGMHQDLVFELTKHMCSQLANREHVQIYRTSCLEPKRELAYQDVLRLQSITGHCITEARNNDFTDIDVFSSDVILDMETLAEINIYIERIVPESVKSVSISTTPAMVKDNLCGRALDLVSMSKNLQKLHMDDSCEIIDGEKIYMIVESTSTSLSALVLVNVQLVSLGDKLETLLTYPHLRSLGLITVSLSDEQLQFLTTFLAEMSQLCELQLVELLGCSGKAYSYKLDLSEQKKLQKLYLKDLYVEEIIMDASKLIVCDISYLHVTGVMKTVLNYLKEETKLREFICQGCAQATDVNAIADSLRHFISLRSVVLQNMNFDIFVPRVTSGAEHLRNVSLNNVSMTEAALLRLFTSFPAESITVTLDHVSLVDPNRDNEETVCEIVNKKFPYLTVSWILCRMLDKNKRWQQITPDAENSE